MECRSGERFPYVSSWRGAWLWKGHSYRRWNWLSKERKKSAGVARQYSGTAGFKFNSAASFIWPYFFVAGRMVSHKVFGILPPLTRAVRHWVSWSLTVSNVMDSDEGDILELMGISPVKLQWRNLANLKFSGHTHLLTDTVICPEKQIFINFLRRISMRIFWIIIRHLENPSLGSLLSRFLRKI